MKKLLCIIFCLSSFCILAQEEKQEASNILLAKFSYGLELPAGDLSDRFGSGFVLGGGMEYLLKNSLLFGFDADIHFGSNVKEDVLASLRTPEGFIIGNDRAYADIFLRMRAYSFNIHFGKIFSSKEVKNTGIKVAVGVGLLEHKVRLQDNSNSTIQLFGDYKKGYDRLTNGISLHQFIGYQYMSPDRRINLFAGLEFTQAFTKNRRDWNFDLFKKDNTSRTDILIAAKVGLILPFYLKQDPSTIYY